MLLWFTVGKVIGVVVVRGEKAYWFLCGLWREGLLVLLWYIEGKVIGVVVVYGGKGYW